MGDAYVYHNSLESDENEFLFENKQFIPINDPNNGSYPSAQVKFYLSQITNSGKYVSWERSYLVVPLVVNLETPGCTTSTLENAFAVSLKNGYHQLINSIDCQISNNSVVNLTNFSNMAINYKLLTSASKEDEQIRLPSIGFHMDTAESISYQQTGSGSGVGETNNVIKDALFNPTTGWGGSSALVNKGRQKRVMTTGFNPMGGLQSVFHGTSGVNCAVSGKNSLSFTPAVGSNTTSIQYYVLATIRLADIHDVFKKLPLVKGMYMNLTLNLNTQCSSVITLGTSGTVFTSSVTSSQNGVFPAMISPLTIGNGCVATGCASVTLSVGVGKSLNGAFSHPTMTNCRMYSCTYSMSPLSEQKYLSVMPKKKILYDDILSFQILNVGAGQNVNNILANGVSRIRFFTNSSIEFIC